VPVKRSISSPVPGSKQQGLRVLVDRWMWKSDGQQASPKTRAGEAWWRHLCSRSTAPSSMAPASEALAAVALAAMAAGDSK